MKNLKDVFYSISMLRIKKNDTVKIVRGIFKGKEGFVTKVSHTNRTDDDFGLNNDDIIGQNIVVAVDGIEINLTDADVTLSRDTIFDREIETQKRLKILSKQNGVIQENQRPKKR
jgi:ribosomal protein L24